MLKDTVENYESRGGETDTVPIECPICHQRVLCKITPDMAGNKEILKELVMECCSCKEAQIATKRKKQKEQINEKMQKVLGEQSGAPVSAETYEAIRLMALQVCWKKVWKATISLSKTEKVKLSVDSDGQLNIVREERQITGETV